MVKGITQLSLLAGALVTTAFVEAVLPIWMADQVFGEGDRLTSADYGSLQAWQECTAKTEASACTSKYAALQDNVLTITDIWIDDGTHCGDQPATARHFAGTIENTSDTIVATSAAWRARVKQNGIWRYGRGGSTHEWFAPRTRKTACLLMIDFQTSQNAALFETSGIIPAPHITSQRGLEDRG